MNKRVKSKPESTLLFRLTACVPLVLTVLLFTTLFSGTASASQTKNVEGVSPRIGQRGTTVEVTIVGVSIHDPREIVFFKPGIRAFHVRTPETPPPRRGLAHGGRIEEAVVCEFEIANDCPLGEHPFRLLTATELTCIGTFHVSPFPVEDENEEGRYTNDTLKTARPVVPNVTVRGKLGNGNRGDVDVYRVQGKAGQQLSVEVDCARLADVHYGGSEFDLAVRVLDENGRVLASNDDNPQHLQDPMLSVILSQDGMAFVEVKRSVFTPRQTDYCVHIGTNRRPLIAFPAGGQAGIEQKLTMIGDPLGPFDVLLAVPPQDGSFEYFGDAPSPVLLRSSHFPNVLEDASAAETRVQNLPVALNGVIDSRADTDSFRLSVKKGEPLHVRLFSAALGSPLDPRIRISPIADDGKAGPAELEVDDVPLTDRDVFGTSYRSGGGRKDVLDPSVIWEPKVDGDYVLEISDSSGSGGPDGVYRIEIELPRTVVQTVLASRTNDWVESTRVSGLAVPQGNRWTVNLSLPRGQWTPVKGEFDLVAHGLPAGVRLVAPRVKAGVGSWPVQLVAEPTAQPGGAVITFEAKPVNVSQKVETRSQQNVPFINHPGGDAWHAVQVDRYIMAVTDPSPFTLDIEQPPVALVRGGELSVPVRITRRQGFEGPIEFSVGFIDRSIDTQPATTIPAGESEGILRLSARSSAPLGTLPLVVIGSTMNETISPYLGAGHIRVSSEIVDLTVSEPYVELAAQAQSVRRGERKKFVWTVQHKSPFEGKAAVTLLGLPKGVTAVEPLPVLTRESTEIAFELQATDEALLGQVPGLSCEVTVPVAGQEIRQRTGKGSLRIDPALQVK
ncbi:MAG: pre-peptidase C-terminal domain-containing protein [Rhodopirellula sp.]|nr:pre-peptidase C-terminal domain-containing protein [Rhodopirellula sp.]